ncbi:MAG: hypothetical protein HYV27_25450 [Candidatus Hydrogenedentes bacterium]|nr:hypothetical protein [Candidatus Hydrogenedentota bacterium]
MAGPAPQAFRTGQRSAPPIGADELSKRVLRGSAPRSKPMWVKGLWPGAVSLALCIFVYVNDDVKTIQPYFSYGVMVIGGFTMIWGADGLRRSDWEPKERYLCGVPFAMGLVALILAFFLRGV